MKTRAILNKGLGAWAFQELAQKLSNSLWLEISETPADYNYVLGWDGDDLDSSNTFIPCDGIDSPSQEVIEIAIKTFQATNLFNSFGCIDLIRDENGNWLVLEVGTDGVFSYVDREIGDRAFEKEINVKIAKAFWTS